MRSSRLGNGLYPSKISNLTTCNWIVISIYWVRVGFDYLVGHNKIGFQLMIGDSLIEGVNLCVRGEGQLYKTPNFQKYFLN